VNVRIFLTGAGLAMIVAALLYRPITIFGMVRVPVIGTRERLILGCLGAGLIVGCVIWELAAGPSLNPWADLAGSAMWGAAGLVVSVAFQWVTFSVAPAEPSLSGHWSGILDYAGLNTSHAFDLDFPDGRPARLTVRLREGGICLYALTTRAQARTFGMRTEPGTRDCELGIGVLRMAATSTGALTITIDDGTLASGTATRELT
jgi:hypothetical protein